jgi:thioesterase domain-containing protein
MDLPIYGLQAFGLEEGEAPLENIEKMAAEYLSEIRAVQPHGPYYLGGWSMGGLIAYEMAQELTENGEKVNSLVLVDTYPNLYKSNFRDEEQEALVHQIAGQGFDSQLKDIYTAHEKAILEYQSHIRPFAGPTKILLAKDEPMDQIISVRNRWNELLQDHADIELVAGNHFSMIRSPNVRNLAEKLRPMLEIERKERHSLFVSKTRKLSGRFT